MRTISEALTLSSSSLGASITSQGVCVALAFNASVQVSWTGTPTGTLKLQCSNDAGQPNAPTEAQRIVGVSNWTDIPNATTALSGAAGSAIYQIPDVSFNFLRLVYTFTSSTGTITSARFALRAV